MALNKRCETDDMLKAICSLGGLWPRLEFEHSNINIGCRDSWIIMEEKVCVSIHMSVLRVLQPHMSTDTCLVTPVKMKTYRHESVGEHSSSAQG